jgi:hypothetical protein
MKILIKLIFTFFLVSTLNKSFSQNTYKISREKKEIKYLFEDYVNNTSIFPIISEKGGGLKLPAFFTCYQDFNKMLKNTEKSWNGFMPSSFLFLNKNDCSILNKILFNDTTKLYIQKDWFSNDKIEVFSDAVSNFQNPSYRGFIKPIFFKNFTMCYIACFNETITTGFFLKKKNDHWILCKIHFKSQLD